MSKPTKQKRRAISSVMQEKIRTAVYNAQKKLGQAQKDKLDTAHKRLRTRKATRELVIAYIDTNIMLKAIEKKMGKMRIQIANGVHVPASAADYTFSEKQRLIEEVMERVQYDYSTRTKLLTKLKDAPPDAVATLNPEEVIAAMRVATDNQFAEIVTRLGLEKVEPESDDEAMAAEVEALVLNKLRPRK